MRKNALPGWLTVVLVLVALAVLGPPALALLAAAVGVAISLTAVLLKVGVAVLVVLAVVALFRAVFGRSTAAPLPRTSPSLETIGSSLERDERERREALDRELDAAIRNVS